MKNIIKLLAAILLIFVMLFNTVSCGIFTDLFPDNVETNEPADQSFYIDGPLNVDLKVGESFTLNLVKSEDLLGEVVWTSSSSCASVEGGVVTALEAGIAVIKATLGSKSDRVIINVTETEDEYIFGSEYPCISVAEAREIAGGYTNSASSEKYYMVATVIELTSLSNGEMTVADETGSIYVYRSTDIDGLSLSASGIEEGHVILISGTLRNYKGTLEIERGQIIAHYDPQTEEPPRPNQGGNDDPDIGGDVGDGGDITIPGTDDPITSDPYVGVDEDEFYANYTPAISYMDAYYRTKHNLMSGSINEQEQEPTISPYQPKSNGRFIRNNIYIFSEDGNTYYVVDCYGEIVSEIYKGGAYVVLEEVAAYVFAFGEPPANHSASKNTKPTQSAWGEYLRVNNTKFSGNTSQYPYEPVLPRISGCGGDLTYYEMDIGTTGTDCDPRYDAAIYNNGYSITRGAARIVYSCKDRNGNKIIDLDERYVFYTYNHYNDFQEYLNYYGGWGEMFGNITGGGSISSKNDYNPTDYVEVVRGTLKETVATVVVYYYLPKEEYAA